MPVRPLVLYPDPRLRERAGQVVTFDDDLAAMADDLAETLRAVSAIGLAGPHVGIMRRLVVVRLALDAEIRTYVNPEVVWASAELATHEEGSVSMPGVRETLTRPERVRIRFQTLSGEREEEELAGFPAAVHQHEIDQLDGIFWIERLSRLKRERILKRFSKIRSA